MASQLKSFDLDKLTGRIYTPQDIVSLILDEIGFISEFDDSFKLLDPACGDGAFLREAARRILDSNLSNLKKQTCLENLYGWDIDHEAIEVCLEKLNAMSVEHGLENIQWNILVNDALSSETIERYSRFFDFVVANPPYVRIQHLTKETREYLSNNFTYCTSGSTDIYFAFIELAEALIKPLGRAGYITPNSFLNSEAGRPMRSAWTRKQHVTKLMNFGHHQIFSNASTYNAVFFFDSATHPKIEYETWSYPLEKKSAKLVGYQDLANRAIWNLDVADADQGALLLRDICSIHVGIQTLADKIFYITPTTVNGTVVEFVSRVNGQKYQIEEALLKPAVKASKLGSTPLKDLALERLIWPYPEIIEAGSKALSESDLLQTFPHAHRYFTDHKKFLDARDNGAPNSAGWYAFARQQGLRSQLQPKIVFPPMVEKPFFVIVDDPETIIYSGYFVLSKHPLRDVLEVLESDEMTEWVRATGRDFRGGWKSMSKKLLETFPIPLRFESKFAGGKLF